jgi:hypothetical protein
MTSGDQIRDSRFVGQLEVFTMFSLVPESSPCLLVVLFSFQALWAMSWTMPRMILGEVAL